MNSLNVKNLGIRKRVTNRTSLIKIGVCLFFICLILLNSISINNQHNQNNFSNNNFITENEDNNGFDQITPKNSAINQEYQDPFTINFSKIWNYFRTNFKSQLTDYDISTYIREKTIGGATVDNGVYSIDNLQLYYTSLGDPNRDQIDRFQAFVNLKSTPLWYEEDVNNFEYGFIGNIDGNTGAITDDDRYLIDNVMLIYLLLEDATTSLGSINYAGHNANTEFLNAFYLMNSSVFYDDIDGAFKFSNSTGDTNRYNMKSNFYTILANYLIHQSRSYISTSIANRAYLLANNATETIVHNMWDNDDDGFFRYADINWEFSVSAQRRKYLDVNALGILTLLEYYIEKEGMYDANQYLENATLIYDALETNLWNGNAYEPFGTEDWTSLSSVIDLEANSIMLRACLKLFEVTGDFKYYERAFELYQYFEETLYNSNINAYEKTSTDTNINFHANLRSVESYLNALGIYDSVVFSAAFNETSNDFIFNQGIINISCDYAFEKQFSYTQPVVGSNTTTFNNITDGSIVYTLRYSNNTIIDELKFNILDNTANHYYNSATNTTTFIYPITEALPRANGYSITIKINSTYFRFKYDNLTFNIIYGLKRVGIIDGLKKIDDEDDFYQGQTENITVQIQSNYNHNITLNASISGFGILNYTQPYIKFENNSRTFIEFDIEAQFDAISGARFLTITIGNGSIIYLDFSFEIYITDALTYSNLIYQREVVLGGIFEVTLDLINYLPNDNQSLNLTFTGEYLISQIITPITLEESETKKVSVRISVLNQIEVDTIEIGMKIMKGNNTIKSRTLSVNILTKFEIISINFPEKVTQGVPTQLILIIKNNKETSEEFTLIINDEKIDTNLEELVPGENRVVAEILPTINPYEFGYKKFYIVLEDENNDKILTDYFESEIQLSAFYLLVFYVLPLIVPIGILLHYKNKVIKIKLLRK